MEREAPVFVIGCVDEPASEDAVLLGEHDLVHKLRRHYAFLGALGPLHGEVCDEAGGSDYLELVAGGH